MLNRNQIQVTNLSNEELKNILRFVDKGNRYFSSNLKNKITIKVRYDSYNDVNRFDISIPVGWLPTWSQSKVLDVVRRGLVD